MRSRSLKPAKRKDPSIQKTFEQFQQQNRQGTVYDRRIGKASEDFQSAKLFLIVQKSQDVNEIVQSNENLLYDILAYLIGCIR